MKQVSRASIILWLSWAFVGLPTLWGIWQTLYKALALFGAS
jgi:hypothetical protein